MVEITKAVGARDLQRWSVPHDAWKKSRMVEIRKLPPGEAVGARDLQRWSVQRMADSSGYLVRVKKGKKSKGPRSGRQMFLKPTQR